MDYRDLFGISVSKMTERSSLRTYVKVRKDHPIVSVPVIIAVGVNTAVSAFSARRRGSRNPPLPSRGREGLSPSPPSEPCGRFSRTRLSSWWFPHRGLRAARQAVSRANTLLYDPGNVKRWSSSVVTSTRSPSGKTTPAG